MTASPPVSRVVVVGGGILGVSSAVHLARLGVSTILVTDGRPANGASGRSLAWLNSSRRRSDAYHRLRMIGIDRYRSLAARHPDAAWLRFDGGLTWDADDDDNDIAGIYAHEKALGYDAAFLSAEEVGAVTPGVDAGSIAARGAIFNPGEGWVDLPSLIDLLLAEFHDRGGALVTDAGKATVTVTAGRAGGVTMADGRRFEADAVLLAAGADVPAIVAREGQHIADGTPISLLVRTRPVAHALRAVLNTPRVAIRPTPTGALVLDSAWSEEEITRHPDGSFEVRDATIRGLLAEASKVLAGNPTLELDSYGAGPKPIPGDGEPVFGPLEAIPGYHVAFSHSGATLGLIAGELLAGEIASGTPHPLLAPFRPARFARAA
ncbi:NAD(P)/FAD-dependent oxidoreductase [Labrys monachus]|uniref:Glycine/D-amino acid oxidase-like deaminating enzyme n=1 Tax=Labrys monachus TaxID=217067 RepID=A0ABU0FC94_9HYPH|nr:FAD-binding oxidoreductase [Labrys monachus]MDQ0392056.1 glycine/D-amino acid oxidase-like deaminating enzyme [Labrys monachus]